MDDSAPTSLHIAGTACAQCGLGVMTDSDACAVHVRMHLLIVMCVVILVCSTRHMNACQFEKSGSSSSSSISIGDISNDSSKSQVFTAAQLVLLRHQGAQQASSKAEPRCFRIQAC